MKRNSYFHIDKIFLRSLTVHDIAELLPSFGSETFGASAPLKAIQLKYGFKVEHLEPGVKMLLQTQSQGDMHV